MVHTFTALGQYLAADVNSGAVHVLDEMSYRLLSAVGEEGPMAPEMPEALAEQLRRIDPGIELTLDRVRVDAGNAAALFAGERIVCEAFDDPRCKADLVNALLTEAPNTGVVAGSGMAGAGPADALVTRRVGRRLFVCGDGEVDVADEALFAPRVALCAAQQALVVVRLVLGLEGN